MTTNQQMQYAGAAVQTTLNGAINNSVLSITVVATTGYPPSGTPFTVTIDQGDPTLQETVKVSSYSGLTLTLSDRGWDGTTAQSHQSGAPVLHTPDAAGLTDLMAKAYAVTTKGDIAFVNTTSGVVMSRLAIGTTYQVVGAGASGVPAYQASHKTLMTATGDIIYASAVNTGARLGVGTTGQVLTVAAGLPSWAADKLSSTLTTTGDLAYASGANTPARLAIGTSAYVLTVSGGLPVWAQDLIAATLTTTGDVLYASSANTPHRLAIGTANQVLGVSSGLPAWVASTTSTLTATGDLVYASAANTLARLAVGTSSQFLGVSGGLPAWVTYGTAVTHAATDFMASSTVTTAGDLIYGTGSGTIARLAIGAAKKVLKGGATAPAWASLIDSWSNQVAGGTATVSTAYADYNTVYGAGTMATIAVSGYTTYWVTVSADLKNVTGGGTHHSGTVGVSLDTSFTTVIASFATQSIADASTSVITFSVPVTLADTNSHNLTINALTPGTGTMFASVISAFGIS